MPFNSLLVIRLAHFQSRQTLTPPNRTKTTLLTQPRQPNQIDREPFRNQANIQCHWNINTMAQL